MNMRHRSGGNPGNLFTVRLPLFGAAKCWRSGTSSWPIGSGSVIQVARFVLNSLSVIAFRVGASRTPHCASSMIFKATSRVAGSSVNVNANFPHTVSSATDISPMTRLKCLAGKEWANRHVCSRTRQQEASSLSAMYQVLRDASPHTLDPRARTRERKH